MDEEGDPFRSVLPNLGEVASDLVAPGKVGRTFGRPAERFTPGMQVDGEKYVRGFSRIDSTVNRSPAMIEEA